LNASSREIFAVAASDGATFDVKGTFLPVFSVTVSTLVVVASGVLTVVVVTEVCADAGAARAAPRIAAPRALDKDMRMSFLLLIG
jgi:hypothetical protein